MLHTPKIASLKPSQYVCLNDINRKADWSVSDWLTVAVTHRSQQHVYSLIERAANVSFWGHFKVLTVAGQPLPSSHCPLRDATSESCCELSATCCAHFPSFAFCPSAGYILLKTLHPWQIPLFVAVSQHLSPSAQHCCRTCGSSSLLFWWRWM